jgi:putative transcriptional regulator
MLSNILIMVGDSMIKNRLREIRMKEFMMSQKDFCEVIGINKRTYSPLEGNKVQGNIENIFKIARNWGLCSNGTETAIELPFLTK